MTLPALIAQLTAATEGSRELDGDIAKRQGWIKCHDGTWTDPSGTWGRGIHPPDWTRSVDMALTLVPEGWMIDRISEYATPTHCWICTFRSPRPFRWAEGAYVRTAPLAICLASLRAIESMKRGTE